MFVINAKAPFNETIFGAPFNGLIAGQPLRQLPAYFARLATFARQEIILFNKLRASTVTVIKGD